MVWERDTYTGVSLHLPGQSSHVLFFPYPNSNVRPSSVTEPGCDFDKISFIALPLFLSSTLKFFIIFVLRIDVNGEFTIRNLISEIPGLNATWMICGSCKVHHIDRVHDYSLWQPIQHTILIVAAVAEVTSW